MNTKKILLAITVVLVCIIAYRIALPHFCTHDYEEVERVEDGCVTKIIYYECKKCGDYQAKGGTASHDFLYDRTESKEENGHIFERKIEKCQKCEYEFSGIWFDRGTVEGIAARDAVSEILVLSFTAIMTDETSVTYISDGDYYYVNGTARGFNEDLQSFELSVSARVRLDEAGVGSVFYMTANGVELINNERSDG